LASLAFIKVAQQSAHLTCGSLRDLHLTCGILFAIETLEMIEGDLPSRSRKLVKEWGLQYKNELLNMWQNNEFKKLPGLE